MNKYRYIVEDGGDGSASVRFFANEEAFQLFIDLVEDQYILDDGILTVFGEIENKKLWDVEKVKELRGE